MRGGALQKSRQRNVGIIYTRYSYRDCGEWYVKIKDQQPVASRPRRLRGDEVEVKQQISKWLEKGIIEPANPGYASPLVVTRRKNHPLFLLKEGWGNYFSTKDLDLTLLSPESVFSVPVQYFFNELLSDSS